MITGPAALMPMNKKIIIQHLKKIQTFLYCFENFVLMGLLLLMISIAVIQIILRNLFQAGIVWGDLLVRILVLWIGFAGAITASRGGRHISIDIVSRYLSENAKRVVNCIVELFTSVICLLAAYYSARFVRMEFEEGAKAFANVPVWLCEVIIPFAFTVIAIRFFILFIMNFTKIFNPEP